MPRLAIPVTDDDHILGEDDAQYTLVQYGDLQCPDTALSEPEVQELLTDREGEIRFVYRHFPLVDIHPHALIAAEALEAAAAQDKFWEMRDVVLDNQHSLDRDSLIGYAKEVKLDVDKFTEELTSHKYLGRIDEQIKGAIRSGVEATPTFFLNGEQLERGISLYDVFEDFEEDEDSVE